ncbi:uncharacterized protein [Primulina eburnea]|uniref:uncharacterized protein isoform X1 n=2 Tax=Primulina eburnea TaxID=1245227 RepID=UPI003C6CB371
MVKENKIEKFRFVNPHTIPNLQKNTYDKTGKTERLNKRASSLADRLSGAAMDQVVLVPSCCGFHWTLTVIEPYKEIVYLLDSLSHRIRDEDWKYVVEMALRLFNSTKGRKGRKRVQWEVIKAPKQPGAKQCGYYVMRFIRQITEEVTTLEGDSLRSIVILSCSQKRSILWKKLMRCAPSWPNAYRIIFMNRHCNDVLEDAPAENTFQQAIKDILELICESLGLRVFLFLLT